MTPQETLDGVLAKIQSHANAWREAARRIMDKPAAQRQEADRKLADQLKALALQADQIIDWAEQQQEHATDPGTPAVRGGLFEGPGVVNSAPGPVHGVLIQARDVHGGVTA